MMHGRRRELVRESTLDEAEQNKQRVSKYRTLSAQVMTMKSQNTFSPDALSATRNLLELNTELHTVWNYRRKIFLNLDSWQDMSLRQQHLEEELGFLLEIIVRNIKSYWMWNHRVWALSMLPVPSWERELALVAKLLAVDARNFHGWDYRRFVVAKLRETKGDDVDLAEFAFTTEQINRDCANHSAWHNRSKLLPTLLQRCASPEERKELLGTEVDLILNAIYTDPDDQNAWLYHEWLLDVQTSTEDRCGLLRDKVAAIREFLELEADSRRPMVELVDAFIGLDDLAPGCVTEDERRECVDTLRRLRSIDPYHTGRYNDTETILGKRWPTAAVNE
ncbi:hypothetical protein BX661DRAFT_175597 [Kickxella alabastrina]|uniref:uncharacterized protein n=1 Tax=Kickxella alabastrina TaxID=61397 RepID=UPI00221F8AEC|nr:uncharacterized protein BX661DRAFT_175597 [Kickxella alabastrina]KAI7834824.1 hypothetical protein BX661DRAFT_175597 [Kickxella alabastrina]KAJ1947128.1 Rab geranylgeranyltransferase [Kickxella alabastrina]